MVSFRRTASFAVLAASLLTAGEAAAFRTPEALIRAIYQPLLDAAVPAPDPARVYSAETLARIRRFEGANPGLLSWYPFVAGEPVQIGRLDARQIRLDAVSADIVVTFTNFGEPNQLTYGMVREIDGWRVQDVNGVLAGGVWSARDPIAAGPVRFAIAETVVLP